MSIVSFIAAAPFALLGLHLARVAHRSGAVPDRLHEVVDCSPILFLRLGQQLVTLAGVIDTRGLLLELPGLVTSLEQRADRVGHDDSHFHVVGGDVEIGPPGRMAVT